MERHLLVVLAHPDDESFGCAGRIALHARAGTPVTYLCATRGEMGRHMGRPPFANRETLRELREQELRAACAVLGIGDLRFLGLWDKTVEFVDPAELAGRIAAVMAEVRPSLVITFHPVHGGHQDHCAIGAATMRAVMAQPAAERPRVLCPINPVLAEKLAIPAEPLDISTVAELKKAALRAHRSQSEGILATAARDPEAVKRMEQRLGQEYYHEFSL